MGKIILDDEYYIKVDETGYVLYRDFQRKDKKGREHVQPLGHFMRLHTAVAEYEERKTRKVLSEGEMTLKEAYTRICGASPEEIRMIMPYDTVPCANTKDA